MATFKIGQRVKIVIPPGLLGHPHFNNVETTITSTRLESDYLYDGERVFYYKTKVTDDHRGVPGCSGVVERCLVPLTDPGCDKFIEAMNQFEELLKVHQEPQEIFGRIL